MKPKKNNFTTINKEANKIWSSSVSALEQTTNDSINKAYSSMSSSQKEAAKVQRDAAARLFEDQESALKNIKKGGIRNPSLSELGNNIIWGIYNAKALVDNSKTREEKNNAGNAVYSLERSLEELYSIIEIGKDTDAIFMNEYFGLEGSKNPGQAGGMALVGRDTLEWCKTMSIRGGLAGDDAKETYYVGEDGDIRLKYTGKILNGKTVDKPALVWLNYDPGIVLDLKGENIKMLQTPSSLDVNGEPVSIIDNSLQYNDAYLMLDKKYFETSADGKTQTEFIPANMAKILNDTKSRSSAKASALLAEYDQANRVWRNNFGMPEDLNFSVAPNGNNIDKNQQIEFQKLMFESLKPLIPTVAVGLTTEVIKEEEVKPEIVEEEALTADQFN
tara:strand:- start:2239 stop:3405 length:1167 start_codon:yes stop_codon:yes gene_type:complete